MKVITVLHMQIIGYIPTETGYSGIEEHNENGSKNPMVQLFQSFPMEQLRRLGDQRIDTRVVKDQTACTREQLGHYRKRSE
jgi:hypothetical protein